MIDVAKLGFLRFSGEDPALVLSALARQLCRVHRLSFDSELPDPSVELQRRVAALDTPGDAAELLIDVREALLGGDERRRRGAHFTPHAIARRLTGLAFDAASAREPLDVCDPACGAGTFLVAAHREASVRGFAVPRVWGADVDPLSVEVSRLALLLAAGKPLDDLAQRVVCADSLALGRDAWTGLGRGFDVVVGNPPFLNQLRRGSARSVEESARLSAQLSIGSQPYADTSALFLARAVDLLADPGVVALIQPQSLLSSRDAAGVRGLIDRRAPLVGLWLARRPVFAASVRVCAPVARKGDAAPFVRRFVDAGFDELEPVARGDFDSWADLAAGAAGVPALPLAGCASLRDIGCRATAGFRDQYYGLAGAVREGGQGPRLVTAGSIEPLDLRWGRQAVTFAKQSFMTPVVDLAAVDPAIRGWLEARLRPKVLVATQTRVIEAVVDAAGDCVPSTPVIEVSDGDVSLWHIAAVLTNPVTSAHALRHTIGAALSFDAVKLSARQVLELPVPTDVSRWNRAAALAERASLAEAADKREALRALGEEMCAAYGAPAELTAWWLQRLR